MVRKYLSSILLSITFFMSLGICEAETMMYRRNSGYEHIENNQKQKAKVDVVRVTEAGSIIQRENYLVVNFAQNFNSKYYKTGDYVQFVFNNDLKTREGTLLIPSSSSLIARISYIENPKWFSRNAKVFMEFTHIMFANGVNLPVSMQLADKKKYLQKGARATAGKIAAYTLSIGAVGTGLGAAIGSASGNTIPGVIIGASIGSGVGLVSGVVSPGLHYKAKKGEKLILELQDNLVLPTNL